MLDQKLTRVKNLIEDRPDVFARQASVVTTWRAVGDRRLGPYYSLRYRDGRRQCSVYLGTSADMADAVRGLIAAAQSTRREQLALKHMRATVRTSLREHMRAVRHQLEQVGLTLKGFEVRGWRALHPVARANIGPAVVMKDHLPVESACHGASLATGSNRSSGNREATVS